jgi:hypothetical protein
MLGLYFLVRRSTGSAQKTSVPVEYEVPLLQLVE